MLRKILKAVMGSVSVVGTAALVGGIAKGALDNVENPLLKNCGKVAAACLAIPAANKAVEVSGILVDKTMDILDKTADALRKEEDSDGGQVS